MTQHQFFLLNCVPGGPPPKGPSKGPLGPGCPMPPGCPIGPPGPPGPSKGMLCGGIPPPGGPPSPKGAPNRGPPPSGPPPGPPPGPNRPNAPGGGCPSGPPPKGAGASPKGIGRPKGPSERERVRVHSVCRNGGIFALCGEFFLSTCAAADLSRASEQASMTHLSRIAPR